MIKYPYSKPELLKGDIKSVLNVLNKGYLTQGKKLIEFENYLKKIFKAQHAVVCSSGTAALHLVYNSIGLRKGSALLTSPITFLSTANAAVMCGASVVFSDVDPNTGLMTPETIENALKTTNLNIKVIAVVHLGGRVCDMEGIAKIAKKYNCLVVEDACHAPGAYYNSNNIVGNCKYSIATIFSHHAIKHIAMGEGGSITTNNSILAKKIIEDRSHGIIREKKKWKFKQEKNANWYYEMHNLGWNYRADELTCSLGLSQAKRLNKNIKKRFNLVKMYNEILCENNYLKLPDFCVSNNHAWHLFSIKIDFNKLKKSRGSVMFQLSKYGIGSQVHYIPLFMQPFYKNKHFSKFPGAIEYYNKTLSLPLYVGLNSSDIKYICLKLLKILK